MDNSFKSRGNKLDNRLDMSGRLCYTNGASGSLAISKGVSMSIQEITSRHEAMMRDLVLEGTKANDVAAKYEITASRLSIIRSSPLWQEKENAMREDAFKGQLVRIEGLRDKAIDALNDTVVSDDEAIKLRSAKEILDRTGIISGMKIDSEMNPTINLYIPNNWNNPEGEE